MSGYLKNLKETCFFIEANSFEQYCLWKEYNKKFKWIDISSGCSLHIGNINNDENMRVWVSFSFVTIFNKIICFWYPTSRFVDHNLITDFIQNNYPVKWDDDNRYAMTDANNFHHVINYCKPLHYEIK